MKLKKNSWINGLIQWLNYQAQWLRPGLGIKRWVLLMIIGASFIGLGLALFVVDTYFSTTTSWLVDLLAILSLRGLPDWLRFSIVVGIGSVCIYFSFIGLSKNILQPFLPEGAAVFQAVSRFRRRQRGPKVVVLGGGSGLASILRGLKKHTSNITAIITMADNGGSSGELRRTVGTPPPGDIRNCLTALSEDEAMLTQVFQYRFGKEYNMQGHSLGNLFITAMGDITGSFEEGVAEVGRVLAVTGQVLPATLYDIHLAAAKINPETGEEKIIYGESEISKFPGRIKRVWLEPNDPPAFPPAIKAILSADLIIVGPGSLYTSLVANMLVPDILRAVKASKALRFYICNVTSQPGETDGYSAQDHANAFKKHLNEQIFDLVICNDQFDDIDLPDNLNWVKPDDISNNGYAIYSANLVNKKKPTRHNSERLAEIVMDLFYERTGPLLAKDIGNMT